MYNHAPGMLCAVALLVCLEVFTPLRAVAADDPPKPPEPYDVNPVCEQEKKLAASRARPDGSETLDNGSGSFLKSFVKDSCVAAILNPALPRPNPLSPQSYICVGKRAVVSIDSKGHITDKNVPDPKVKAGKCDTTACAKEGMGLDCFGATQPTSITDQVRGFLRYMGSYMGQPSYTPPQYPASIGGRG